MCTSKREREREQLKGMLSRVPVKEGIISHGPGLLMACSRNTSHAKLPIHHAEQSRAGRVRGGEGLDLWVEYTWPHV